MTIETVADRIARLTAELEVFGCRAKAGQIAYASPVTARDGDVDLLVVPDEDEDDCLTAAERAVSGVVDVTWSEWADEQREHVRVRARLR